MRLVAVSDVFVENLKASTLHQLGIHETELLEANPRMIVLRIPPAGLSGDWAHYTGFGGQFDGLTGLAALLGHRGTSLMESPSTQHMDSVTGPAGAFATLAALHYRAATGRGQVIELAQSENVLTELGDVFVNQQLGVAPERFGNRDRHRAPQGMYQCADGRWLGLTVADDDAVARPHGGARTRRPREGRTARSRRRSPGRARRARRGDRRVDARPSPRTTLSTRCRRPGSRPRRASTTCGSRRIRRSSDRQWIRPLASRDVGTFNHLGHAFRGIPLDWERGAPTLGEDNAYVFQEILGLDDEEYAQLVAAGVATEDYVDRDGNPY